MYTPESEFAGKLILATSGLRERECRFSGTHNDADARAPKHVVAHAAARGAAGFRWFHPASSAHAAERFALHSNKIDRWGRIRLANEIRTKFPQVPKRIIKTGSGRRGCPSRPRKRERRRAADRRTPDTPEPAEPQYPHRPKWNPR
jgi:hypothetical protein